MSPSEWTALLLLCTAMSFTPGPNTTLSTALAANLGLKHALRFCLAVPTGWTLLMLATGLGLGALITGVPALRWGVKLGGVAYMLWLAFKLMGVKFPFRGHPQGEPRPPLAPEPNRNPPPMNLPVHLNVTFWQGVGLQFVNIKAWMLALTLTAGWVVNAAGQAAPNPYERLAMVSGLMVLFAFGSNFTYALIGSLLRDWLTQNRRLLWFNRALALVLAGTAVWMLAV